MLEDPRTAPIGEGLRATLLLLEKLTLTPDDVTPADVDAVRAHGVSDEAIEDAMYVAFLFAMFNRVGDALRFHVPSDQSAWDKGAATLLRIGYR